MPNQFQKSMQSKVKNSPREERLTRGDADDVLLERSNKGLKVEYRFPSKSKGP